MNNISYLYKGSITSLKLAFTTSRMEVKTCTKMILMLSILKKRR